MDLELRRTLVGSAPVLCVCGDVDLSTLPRFTDALTRLVADHPGQIVRVDLDGTGVFDDAALGLVLGAAGRARGTHGDLVIVSTDSRLRARFSDTGFERAVTVTTSISDD